MDKGKNYCFHQTKIELFNSVWWTNVAFFILLFLLWFVVVALQQIVTEMGATYWKFNGDQCEVEMAGISPTPPTGSEGYVDCNCNFDNNTVCHITNLYGFFSSLVVS